MERGTYLVARSTKILGNSTSKKHLCSVGLLRQLAIKLAALNTNSAPLSEGDSSADLMTGIRSVERVSRYVRARGESIMMLLMQRRTHTRCSGTLQQYNQRETRAWWLNLYRSNTSQNTLTIPSS